jgi:hypothetical protein
LIRPEHAGERVDNALALVQRALRQWDAADFVKVEACRELLEMSVVEMREFESELRAGSITDIKDLPSNLALFRNTVAQATRLVDAGAAFYRGLAVRLGRQTQVYNAAGGIQLSVDRSAEHELVG